MVVASAHTLFAASIGAMVTQATVPDVQKVELSIEAQKVHSEMVAKAINSSNVQRTKEEFYKTLQNDQAINGVGVAEDWTELPKIIIPKAEFPQQSGLWTPQTENDTQEPTSTDIWDVVLLKVAMVSKPANWTFSRDGLKFGAKMHDGNFLAAMKGGGIPINLQEGVIMRVKAERKEVLNGQIWEPVSGSWRIVQVISPVPSASPTTLPFPNNP